VKHPEPITLEQPVTEELSPPPTDVCIVCNGSGLRDAWDCPVCGGRGQVPTTRCLDPEKTPVQP
jgi:DnaJ-class molecular chaperone